MNPPLPTTELLGSLNEVERKHAPESLYIAGDRRLLEHGPRVAIVGSRKASSDGLNRAAALAHALAQANVTVVSGLASGVDTAAHETAIAYGGRTVGVIGTPLERAYPKSNGELQERIAREHLLVSQFAPGTKTHPSHFVLRNRTMALLSDATVIVEAGSKSGTEHQAWEAIRLGRQVWVMESLARARFDWVSKLQDYGANVLSRRGLEEFIEHLPEWRRDSAPAF